MKTNEGRGKSDLRFVFEWLHLAGPLPMASWGCHLCYLEPDGVVRTDWPGFACLQLLDLPGGKRRGSPPPRELGWSLTAGVAGGHVSGHLGFLLVGEDEQERVGQGTSIEM